MSDLRKAAEMALKALENACLRELLSVPSEELNRQTIKALRQALAQPEQGAMPNNKWKNVVIIFNDDPPSAGNDYDGKTLNRWSKNFDVYLNGIKGRIYTSLPNREWVGLTDDERWKCDTGDAWEMSVNTETKLKEKNESSPD